MYSRVSTGKELTALASNSNLGLDYIEKQNLAKIWTFLRVGMGFTKNQAAGICGNFYNESKFSSDNAQEQKGENIRMTTIVGTLFQPMIRLDME